MINAADVFKVFAPHRGNAIVTRAGLPDGTGRISAPTTGAI